MGTSEDVYALLRAIRVTVESTSGVRVGQLSYNETVAYDALVTLLAAETAARQQAERDLKEFERHSSDTINGLIDQRAAAESALRAAREALEAAARLLDRWQPRWRDAGGEDVFTLAAALPAAPEAPRCR